MVAVPQSGAARKTVSDQMKTLLWWGIIVGALFPALLYYGVAKGLFPIFGDVIPLSKAADMAMYFVFSLFFLIFVSWFIVDATYKNDVTSSPSQGPASRLARIFSRRVLAWSLVYLVGGFSLFIVYSLVMISAGVSASPFTGYYLYAPAVVYLVFQKPLAVGIAGGFAVLGASLTTWCGASPFGIGLLPLADMGSCLLHDAAWRLATSTPGYLGLHMTLVVWQLLVAMSIAIWGR